MLNAKDLLKKAGREDGHYKDSKYVRMACAAAYSGVLLALDEYLHDHPIEPATKKKRGRKSVKDYQDALARLNKKLLDKFRGAYNVLHLDGYYDGIVERKIIDAGFAVADEIISGIEKHTF